MKLKLTLPTNIKSVVTFLGKARTAIVGVILIGIFGYTAYIVNAATNVHSDAAAGTQPSQIIFDKSAISAVKNRNQVSDHTELGNLGKTDPFAH